MKNSFLAFRIEPLDIDNESQLRAILKWQHDPDFFHLVNPVRDENQALVETSLSMLKKKMTRDARGKTFNYIILDGEKPVGNFSLQLDPPHLYKKIEGTSWLGITIGEKEYWGSGAAQFAMEHFESESKRLGAGRVELGTFEFNLRAQNFYHRLGYLEFARLKNFTYWDGRFWDDIRMEKNL